MQRHTNQPTNKKTKHDNNTEEMTSMDMETSKNDEKLEKHQKNDNENDDNDNGFRIAC